MGPAPAFWFQATFLFLFSVFLLLFWFVVVFFFLYFGPVVSSLFFIYRVYVW